MTVILKRVCSKKFHSEKEETKLEVDRGLEGLRRPIFTLLSLTVGSFRPAAQIDTAAFSKITDDAIVALFEKNFKIDESVGRSAIY